MTLTQQELKQVADMVKGVLDDMEQRITDRLINEVKHLVKGEVNSFRYDEASSELRKAMREALMKKVQIGVTLW